MATTTEKEDANASDRTFKTAATAFLEGVGVMALLGSFMLLYLLGVLVVNETIGAELATGPDWFLLAINSVAAIPVVTSLVMFATWVIGLYDERDTDWGATVVYGAAVGAILAPPFHLLGAVGPF